MLNFFNGLYANFLHERSRVGDICGIDLNRKRRVEEDTNRISKTTGIIVGANSRNLSDNRIMVYNAVVRSLNGDPAQAGASL